MSTTAQARVVVEKTMALTLAEFSASLASLVGPVLTAGSEDVRLPLSGGNVQISFAPLPPVRLGGLLDMPRALIRLTFENVPADARAVFLRRFEIAFQRGGG